MKNDGEACHIMLRAQRRLTVDKKRIDIVEEHNRIVENEGVVALGKFGARPTASRIAPLQKQIENDVGTHLYLVFNERGNFVGFSAEVKSISMADFAWRAPATYPNYYDELGFLASLWIVLKEPLSTTSLAELRSVNNDKPLLEVLSESRASMIIVK